MVRLARVTPWVLLVFLFAGGMAARAAPRRSAARCVRYGQQLDSQKGGVEMRLTNRCRFALSCSIEWTLVCKGESPRGVESATFDLERGEVRMTHASAAACIGDWEVKSVRWSCEEARAPDAKLAPR